MAHRRYQRTLRTGASLLAGLIAGSLLLGTAGAHLPEKFNQKHLGKHAWRGFVKNKVYNKRQADNRFATRQQTEAAVADLRNAILWGKVSAGATGATLLRGRGIASVQRDLAGVYRVTFTRNIDTCGWSATLNDNDVGLPPPGEIAINQWDLADPASLQIRTFDSNGTLTELPPANDGFTVVVHC